jgi:flagellar basal-body rod protein FlgF
MPKIAYLAASAMYVESQALDLAARNLAHAQTPGYRRGVFLRDGFDETLAKTGKTGGLDGNGGAGILGAGSFTDFTQAPSEETGAPLDVAIRGEGFLRVNGPDGKLLLTRAGHLNLDASGRLVTPEGWSVQGQGNGGITIPRNAERLVINQQGRVSAMVREGDAKVEVVVDQLRLSKVDDLKKLKPFNGQYFDPGNEVLSDTGVATQVQQGRLEKGNVEPVQELVAMIAIQRRHDAAQKALRETTNLGGNVSEMLRGA